MNELEKQKIIDTIKQKGATNNCPRCNQKDFTLLEGYFIPEIIPTIPVFFPTSASVRSIVIVCNNCGYMSQHAMGILELLPIINENKEGPK